MVENKVLGSFNENKVQTVFFSHDFKMLFKKFSRADLVVQQMSIQSVGIINEF